MVKPEELAVSEIFYDREYGYVIVTDTHGGEFNTTEVDVSYYGTQPHKAGTLIFDNGDDIDVVRHCIKCHNFRSFADLEDNGGVCSTCITNHDRWADEQYG